jgi:hypothetical protein
MRAIAFLSAAAIGTLLSSSTAHATEVVQNGDFASGDFTDWTTFTTGPNGTLGGTPYPFVSSFDVTGSGAQNAATFNVGEISFTGVQEGGGIFQDITTPSGTLSFSASIASYKSTFNDSAGVFSVLLDGTTLTTDDLGVLPAGGTPVRGTLSFTTAVTPGVHELEILITRPFDSCGEGCTPDEYVTNISATIGSSNQVPEPGTWAMMLLGFSGVGLLGYRRARAGRATLAA